MNRIPIVISPHENELLFSWMYRLAIENNCDNLIEFLRDFVNQYYTKKVNYDLNNIGNLMMCLNYEVPDKFFEDYLNMSLYPYYALFFTSEQQTYYLNTIFRTYRKNSLMGKIRNISLIKQLNFCPECRQHELDLYGHFYYHCEHQLPGVRVCLKHKRPLHRYIGIAGQEFDNDIPSSELILKADLDIEYQYALFVNDLYKEKLDLNFLDILYLIEKGYKKKDYKGIQEYVSELKKSKFSPLLSNRSYRHMHFNKLYSSLGEREIDLTIMLLDLYHSPTNIPHLLSSPSDNFISKLNNEGYEIISEYRKNIVQLKHLSCGTSYITSGSSLSQGWSCPRCDLYISEQKIVQRLVAHIDDGCYELLSPFKSWNTPLKILHKKCGNEFETRLRALIFDGRRCLCSYTYSFETIKNNVEKSGEFTLINYIPTSQEIEVLSNHCKHRFKVDYYLFMKNPICRICSPFYINTKDIFEIEKRKLVGDDYDLIGDFFPGRNGKKIQLLHKACNKTSFYHTNRFMNGQRCPYCTKKISHSKFKTLVSNKSNGRYECIDDTPKKDQMVTIVNKQTGQIKKMYKYLVIQELTRPTPSNKLPI